MSVPENLVALFMDLFVGGDQAHGSWNFETKEILTVREPAQMQQYVDHLEGRLGLGLIPVNESGMCRFGALDIDIDDIDHNALYRTITEKQLPLNVCRSKSGGAHAYVFMKEEVAANAVIASLKQWAVVLGYPKVEIFPKQPKASRENLGSWINLPYYNSDRTVRYAIGPKGALALIEFLSTVKYWDGKPISSSSVTSAQEFKPDVAQMPPCLAKLTQDGLGTGQRDSGMFNFAVFYRKSSPSNWPDLVVLHNNSFVDPPLRQREIEKIIKSVGARKYQYTCNQEPICSLCNRPECLKLPFGVGNEPWKSGEDYAEFSITKCKKIKTDPPKYLIDVNGVEVDLTTEQLISFKLFQKRVFEKTNLLLYPQKSDRWDMQIVELMKKVEEIEAPDDASERGMILDKVIEYLGTGFERSRDKEDLLRGVPVVNSEAVAFRVADLQKYLKSQFIRVENEILYKILHAQQCKFGSVRVKGKVVSVWLFPKDKMNLQTEEFSPPQFESPMEEL